MQGVKRDETGTGDETGTQLNAIKLSRKSLSSQTVSENRSRFIHEIELFRSAFLDARLDPAGTSRVDDQLDQTRAAARGHEPAQRVDEADPIGFDPLTPCRLHHHHADQGDETGDETGTQLVFLPR